MQSSQSDRVGVREGEGDGGERFVSFASRVHRGSDYGLLRPPLAYSLNEQQSTGSDSSENDSPKLQKKSVAVNYARQGPSSTSFADALNLDSIAVIDLNHSGGPEHDELYKKAGKKHWYKGHFKRASTNKVEDVPVIPVHGDLVRSGQMHLKKRHRWKKYKFHLDEKCLFRLKSNSQPRQLSLFLASVKITQIKEKDKEKMYGFEVITPSTSAAFYVESEEERTAWVESITKICNKLTITSITDGSSDKSSNTTNAEIMKERLRQILTYEGNDVCADCYSTDTSWASINLGIFICIKCSGVHRRLGVHISKVRSVELDIWDEDTLEHMKSLGNKKSNTYYEYSIPTTYTKPHDECTDKARERWIYAKYQRRRFCADYVPSASPTDIPFPLPLPLSTIQSKERSHRRTRSSTGPEQPKKSVLLSPQLPSIPPISPPLQRSLSRQSLPTPIVPFSIDSSSPPTPHAHSQPPTPLPAHTHAHAHTYSDLPPPPTPEQTSNHVYQSLRITPLSPKSPPANFSFPSSPLTNLASPPLSPSSSPPSSQLPPLPPKSSQPLTIKDYPNSESLKMLKDSILVLLRTDSAFRNEIKSLLLSSDDIP